MTSRRSPRGGATDTLKRGAGQAATTAQRALTGFVDDHGPQSAAAISYYGLLSLFPLAILLVAVFGLVLEEGNAQERVVEFVLDQLPLREDQGRREIEEVLTSVTASGAGFGIAGGVGLLVAASGVMGAIRKSLNLAWDVEDPRPFFQGKLFDVLSIVGFGLIIASSFALTILVRTTASLSADLEDALGGAGSFIPRLLLSLGQFLPAIVAFVGFLTLFRVVPAVDTRLRDIWPGAAVAALGFEGTKTGFSVYLENFANYSAVYASLAAIIAFLVFVFISANLMLIGAEVAVEWPRVRDGEVEEDEDGESTGKQILGAIRRLFIADRRSERRGPKPDR